MLPRSLYELLPYLYLVIGVVSGLSIESSLILAASLLLILAGLLTLFMRWNYREDRRRYDRERRQESAGNPGRPQNDMRQGQERRQRVAMHFPLTDTAGRLIRQERRRRERRGCNRHSLA